MTEECDHKDDFVLEHYRALRERFTSQGNRLWTRFHLLLTVNVALAGAFLARENLDAADRLARLGPVLGIALSVLWFVIGAQDFWFYEDARARLNRFKFENILARIPAWPRDEEEKTYKAPYPKWLICFKIPKVGVTTFAALVPLLSLALWGILKKYG